MLFRSAAGRREDVSGHGHGRFPRRSRSTRDCRNRQAVREEVPKTITSFALATVEDPAWSQALT